MGPRYPSWWSRYCPQGKTIFWDDTVNIYSASNDDMLSFQSHLQKDSNFHETLEKMYTRFHIDDSLRPIALQSIKVSNPLILKRQIEKAIFAIWETMNKHQHVNNIFLRYLGY